MKVDIPHIAAVGLGLRLGNGVVDLPGLFPDLPGQGQAVDDRPDVSRRGVVMMVFMMVPIFGNMSEALHKISGFLFTGVMTGMTECLAAGETYVMSPLDIAVLFGELLISVLVFLVLYKRNGYEKD